MKVSIEKNEIVIRLPVAKNPAPSKSGKTRLIATTGGFVDALAQRRVGVHGGFNFFVSRSYVHRETEFCNELGSFSANNVRPQNLAMRLGDDQLHEILGFTSS